MIARPDPSCPLARPACLRRTEAMTAPARTLRRLLGGHAPARATPNGVASGTAARAPAGAPFWERLPLEAMTDAQWESLCDGCGKCCLNKLQDEDTGALAYTNAACQLLDVHTCRCSDYAHRWDHVPDCVKLVPAAIRRLRWLPSTCAYRRLAAGDPLPDWHPLITGDPDSVHRAGMSVRGRAVPETAVADLEDQIVDWEDL